MAKQAGRLVVVSARAPFVDEGAKISRAPGGLVSALLPLMHQVGGTWIAAGNERDAHTSCGAEFRVLAVPIPSELRAAWYADASTSALWPLVHGFIERCRFRQHAARAYREVNRRVSEVVVAHAPLRGTVWVHDYQLALVPKFVRAQRPDLTLGFSWHVPWPGEEFFRVLPWRRDLVEGLLGADVIGLHVSRYVDAFASALRGLDIAHRIDGPEIIVPMEEHACRVISCPVGIDVAAWLARGRSADIQGRAMNLRAQLTGSRLLLAVDRLDYAKGIVERLEAFERLLECSVEAREKATLVQIAVPSRETVAAYREVRARVEATVGRIQGRFGTPIRRPLHLFTRSFEAEDLAAFYLAADVAVVTPLRDGLNLVACEYVATQPLPRGRLLLSEMAGVADVLRDACLVNPYDVDALDAALAQVTLSAETEEDAKLMAHLQRQVFDMSVDRWTSTFITHFDRATRSASGDTWRRDGPQRSWSTKHAIMNESDRQEELVKVETRRRAG